MSDYEVKDSGGRDRYPGGATRNLREGKGRYDLISPWMLERLAKVYEGGARLHGDRNWENGLPSSRCIDSALRHINQWRMGMTDEDHLAHAVWNLAAVMHFEELVARGKAGAELLDHPHDLDP